MRYLTCFSLRSIKQPAGGSQAPLVQPLSLCEGTIPVYYSPSDEYPRIVLIRRHLYIISAENTYLVTTTPPKLRLITTRGTTDTIKEAPAVVFT